MKRHRKIDISMCIAFVIFTVYAFTLLYPFVFLLFGSLNASLTDFMAHPLSFPKEISFENFRMVLTDLESITWNSEFNFGSMFFNSITLSVGLTVVSMILQSMAAYVLAKYQFKGNHLIYMVIIVASMIPTVGALPATFRLMSDTYLTNTYIGMLLLQGGAFGGCFLYLHAYFKSIPWSYAEVAMIDGASDFKIFTRIMVPLASKAIKTYSIICFLGFWNDYWLPSLFYGEHPTLAVGLYLIKSSTVEIDGNYPAFFAAMIVVILPVLIFFACFQKQLMGSISEGGLKE